MLPPSSQPRRHRGQASASLWLRRAPEKVDQRHKEAASPAEDELNQSQWVALDLRDPGALPLPNLTGENATPAFAWAFIVFERQAEPGHAGSVLVCDEEIRCSVLATSTPLAPLRAAAEQAVA